VQLRQVVSKGWRSCHASGLAERLTATATTLSDDLCDTKS
jgi:hypothetical protein